MRRNMDLCREILIFVEKLEFKSQPQKIDIDGIDEQEIQYHLKLLNQAGLLDAVNLSKSTQETKWRVNALTWEGHEFVEASRNSSHWQDAKNVMNEKGIGMAFDTLKAVLIASAKAALSI